MRQYEILYTNFDMPSGYISKAYKWAHNEKEATRLITRKAPDRNGICLLKRGSSAKILEVKEI